jgi:hypothetical protein
MTKLRRHNEARHIMIVFLYPILPEKRPARRTATPYPADIKVKIPLARAWLTMNSSSRRGRMGEKSIRTEKLMNQIKTRKNRKRTALPLNSLNRVILRSNPMMVFAPELSRDTCQPGYSMSFA